MSDDIPQPVWAARFDVNGFQPENDMGEEQPQPLPPLQHQHPEIVKVVPADLAESIGGGCVYFGVTPFCRYERQNKPYSLDLFYDEDGLYHQQPPNYFLGDWHAAFANLALRKGIDFFMGTVYLVATDLTTGDCVDLPETNPQMLLEMINRCVGYHPDGQDLESDSD